MQRERQNPQEREASLAAALAMIDAAAAGDPQDVRAWPVWDGLRPHIRASVDIAEARRMAVPTARLMSGLGVLFMSKAQHSDAEPLMRRALEIDEKRYVLRSPETSTTSPGCCRTRTGCRRPGR